jgi:hypothetical protein
MKAISMHVGTAESAANIDMGTQDTSSCPTFSPGPHRVPLGQAQK